MGGKTTTGTGRNITRSPLKTTQNKALFRQGERFEKDEFDVFFPGEASKPEEKTAPVEPTVAPVEAQKSEEAAPAPEAKAETVPPQEVSQKETAVVDALKELGLDGDEALKAELQNAIQHEDDVDARLKEQAKKLYEEKKENKLKKAQVKDEIAINADAEELFGNNVSSLDDEEKEIEKIFQKLQKKHAAKAEVKNEINDVLKKQGIDDKALHQEIVNKIQEKKDEAAQQKQGQERDQEAAKRMQWLVEKYGPSVHQAYHDAKKKFEENGVTPSAKDVVQAAESILWGEQNKMEDAIKYKYGAASFKAAMDEMSDVEDDEGEPPLSIFEKLSTVDDALEAEYEGIRKGILDKYGEEAFAKADLKANDENIVPKKDEGAWWAKLNYIEAQLIAEDSAAANEIVNAVVKKYGAGGKESVVQEELALAHEELTIKQGSDFKKLSDAKQVQMASEIVEKKHQEIADEKAKLLKAKYGEEAYNQMLAKIKETIEQTEYPVGDLNKYPPEEVVEKVKANLEYLENEKEKKAAEAKKAAEMKAEEEKKAAALKAAEAKKAAEKSGGKATGVKKQGLTKSVGKIELGNVVHAHVEGSLQQQPGAIYEGSDGERRLLQWYPSALQAYCEVVAARLYGAVGSKALAPKLTIHPQKKSLGNVFEGLKEFGGQKLAGNEHGPLTEASAKALSRSVLADLVLGINNPLAGVYKNMKSEPVKVATGQALLYSESGKMKTMAESKVVPSLQELMEKEGYSQIFKSAGVTTSAELRTMLGQQLQEMKALYNETDGFRALFPAVGGVVKGNREAALQVMQARFNALSKMLEQEG